MSTTPPDPPPGYRPGDHVVDSLLCYLGWFWPLWDSRRQTFADKIMGTVVVVQPQERDAA